MKTLNIHSKINYWENDDDRPIMFLEALADEGLHCHFPVLDLLELFFIVNNQWFEAAVFHAVIEKSLIGGKRSVVYLISLFLDIYYGFDEDWVKEVAVEKQIDYIFVGSNSNVS